MILRQWDRHHPTALTILRPRMARYYGPAADAVLLDPYPIPTQPLTWMSNSIDMTRRALGPTKQIWAIVQAFNWGDEPGHPKNRPGRFPTNAEQRALAYLAITHQANGIFFFQEKHGRKKSGHWKGVKTLVNELNCLQPLLLSAAASWQPQLQSASFDLKGRPWVHFLVKHLGKKRTPSPAVGCPFLKKGHYLIAVNAVSNPTLVVFRGFSEKGTTADIFQGKKKNYSGGKLSEIMEAHGVRIWYLGGG